MSFQLFKNYLFLIGGEAVSKLIVFAAFVYLARLLGPANFGYIEWSGAVLMCASLVVDQGLSSYGAREIAKNPAQTARLVGEIVTARLFLAGVGCVVLSAFAVWFVREASVARLLLVFGLSLWALPFHLNWVFQGHDRTLIIASTQIIRYAIFAFVVFVCVENAADLVFVGLAEVAAVTCAAVFSFGMYRRCFSAQVSWQPMFSLKLFREGFPIGLSQMFWTVKMFGATLIVGLVATAQETGYFAGAMRILIAFHAFVWLYYLNLLPSLARAWQDGQTQFSALITNSMRIVLPICLLGAGVWIALAPFIITLAYGQDFAHGAGALQWMAGVGAAAAISGHYRFGLIAANFQNKEMLAAAIGAVLATILIPLGYFQSGTSGAAAGLCFAETIVLAIVRLMAERALFSDKDWPTAKRNLKPLPEIAR